MSKNDRQIGMGVEITRCDFLNCPSIAVDASLLPLMSCIKNVVEPPGNRYYPPELTGLRGSHVGSFEVANAAFEAPTKVAITEAHRAVQEFK